MLLRVPQGRPLRVASFPRPGDGTHDYIDLLAAPLANQGVELLSAPERFGPRLAGRDRPDVVHLHWIEYLIRSQGSGAKAAARAAARNARLHSGLLALRARGVGPRLDRPQPEPARGAPPAPGERRDARDRSAGAPPDRALEFARTRVRETYGEDAKVTTIPLGNFIGRYPEPRRSREELRAMLGIAPGAFVFLAFGQVRRYKRIPEMIAAFREIGRSDRRWLIAGSAGDPAERAAVEHAAAGDPRIILRSVACPTRKWPSCTSRPRGRAGLSRALLERGPAPRVVARPAPPSPRCAGALLKSPTPPAVEPFEEGGLALALDAISHNGGEPRAEAALAARARPTGQRSTLHGGRSSPDALEGARSQRLGLANAPEKAAGFGESQNCLQP